MSLLQKERDVITRNEYADNFETYFPKTEDDEDRKSVV